jgi:Predicted amidophosphoribosyltransferases
VKIKRSWHEWTEHIRQPKNQEQVYSWSRIIQNLVFPPTCLLCGDQGEEKLDLCRNCRETLPYLGNTCRTCGLPLTQSDLPLCGTCLKEPPPFDRMICAFRYEEPIRHLIQSLKFRSRHANARLLGTLLAESFDTAPALPEVVIPVPLHPFRYRERRFNQALEIARVVSSQLSIRLDYATCHRIRPTNAQAQLHAEERRKNIREAFAISSPLAYRHIALLDDVVTTGATVSELATQFRQAGAARIDVWACARALP